MKKIEVLISWSGDNYCADAVSNDINGVVLTTEATLEGVKKEFKSALQFHVESAVADGDKLPEWLVSGNYELDYVLDTSALLHSLDGILTRSAIARVSGINERQIGHYASGHRTPRPQQREKIINGIRTISRELASVAQY
jgi:predicted RNase H-like HicB family nuclease